MINCTNFYQPSDNTVVDITKLVACTTLEANVDSPLLRALSCWCGNITPTETELSIELRLLFESSAEFFTDFFVLFFGFLRVACFLRNNLFSVKIRKLDFNQTYVSKD